MPLSWCLAVQPVHSYSWSKDRRSRRCSRRSGLGGPRWCQRVCPRPGSLLRDNRTEARTRIAGSIRLGATLRCRDYRGQPLHRHNRPHPTVRARHSPEELLGRPTSRNSHLDSRLRPDHRPTRTRGSLEPDVRGRQHHLPPRIRSRHSPHQPLANTQNRNPPHHGRPTRKSLELAHPGSLAQNKPR